MISFNHFIFFHSAITNLEQPCSPANLIELNGSSPHSPLLSIALAFIAFILNVDFKSSPGVSRQYGGFISFVARESRFKGEKITRSAVIEVGGAET